MRSIPACAGEPFPHLDAQQWVRVYPRVCGGTRLAMLDGMADLGLSPRVRGNLQSAPWVLFLLGSIPACAGEPVSPGALFWLLRVYPRVCGGTVKDASAPVAETGLSPRVRGNRTCPTPASSHKGSIPACAGEPGRLRHRGRFARVYPRVCGGTALPAGTAIIGDGLSPRVRGNPP